MAAQIVLVHGIRTSATMWRAQIAHLDIPCTHAVTLRERFDQRIVIDPALVEVGRPFLQHAADGGGAVGHALHAQHFDELQRDRAARRLVDRELEGAVGFEGAVDIARAAVVTAPTVYSTPPVRINTKAGTPPLRSSWGSTNTATQPSAM